MRLSGSQLHIKFFKLGLSGDKLKSPSKAKISYIGLKKFKARFNSLINERSFCEGGARFNSLINERSFCEGGL